MGKDRPVPRFVKVLFWLWFILPVGGSSLVGYHRPRVLILSVVGIIAITGGLLLLIVLRYGTSGVQELYGAPKNGADSKDVANLIP